MQTYQDLKNYENELQNELDILIYNDSNSYFNKYMIKDIEKELIKIERYINKFKLKFKYSMAWCCKYNKQWNDKIDTFYIKYGDI